MYPMLITPEQKRFLFLYEYKLGHSPSQANKNINMAFGPGTVKVRTLQKWYEKFNTGDESLKDQPRAKPKKRLNECQLGSNAQEIQKIVKKRGPELKSSSSPIPQHLKGIGKGKKLIPQELQLELQKRQQLQNNLQELTGVETMIPYFPHMMGGGPSQSYNPS